MRREIVGATFHQCQRLWSHGVRSNKLRGASARRPVGLTGTEEALQWPQTVLPRPHFTAAFGSKILHVRIPHLQCAPPDRPHRRTLPGSEHPFADTARPSRTASPQISGMQITLPANPPGKLPPFLVVGNHAGRDHRHRLRAARLHRVGAEPRPRHREPARHRHAGLARPGCRRRGRRSGASRRRAG